MRTSRLLPAFLAVLLLGFGVAACGDDDDPAVSADAETEQPAGDYGGGAAKKPAGSSGSAITIAGLAFDPASTDVKTGATVTVTNEDDVPHTWTADDGSWDSGQLSKGDSFEHTFTQAGSFAYHCEIHPSMTGTVVVK